MKKLKRIIQKKLGVLQLFSDQKEIIDKQNQIIAYQQELLKAHTYRNTIQDSEWLKYKGISPGESAVDYGFCYTLYRVLSSMKPNNILEFGLGQSSKLIHQYAYHFQKNAYTVEHDSDWISFFSSETEGKYPVNIKQLELCEINYKGHTSLSYKDCSSVFCGEKFDLIVVDGPFGYGTDVYFSRPQILDLAKNSLAENFVILMDDYNRQGEKNTTNELFDYFDIKGISYVHRVYSASKQHILITTPHYKFLTTL